MADRDAKIAFIKAAEKQREEEAYNKVKEAGNAAFADLEGLKLDQEGQV